MNTAIAHKEAIIFNQTQEFYQLNGITWPGQLLRYAYQQFPDRTALIFKDTSITYKEWYERSNQVCNYIKKQGVTPKSHVLISIENSIDFYIAYFAVWHAGAIVVPLNTFLTATEIEHILGDAQPSLIITQTQRVEQFSTINNSVPIITVDELTAATSESTTTDIQDIPLQEMCVLLYTSGTTGLPKGVMLSCHNILHNIAQSMARFGFSDHEIIFGVLPLFHVFTQMTCIWASVFLGTTIIIIPKIERRFILEGLKHKPTIFLGVPALYGLLCLLKTAPLESVNYFISGGDALPDKIRSAFALVYGRKIVNGYGMTETSPVIAADFDDELTYTNTVGSPLHGITCSIRDKDNKPVETGTIGQLWIQSESIMLGYYNSPELTANTIQDGWFNTGDCAYFDRSNKLVITGREKDLIINKGFNIYPQEIENVILSSPDVIRAAVVGKQDSLEGEVPVAFVQLHKPVKNIEKQLRALCTQQLAPYKIPHTFFTQIEDLPLTSTGKVDKKVLREKIKSD